MRTRLSVGSIAILVLAFALAMRVGRAAPSGEWRAYASDKGGSRYSPLDQINRTTVKNLKIAWRQSILPPEMREAGTNSTIPNVSQNTALMVGGRLFVSMIRYSNPPGLYGIHNQLEFDQAVLPYGQYP